MRFRYAIASAIFALAGTSACAGSSSADDTTATGKPHGGADGGLDGGLLADVSSPLDASIPDGATADAIADVATEDADFCSGAGPVVQVGNSQYSYTTCTGTIAASIFTAAMCTCGNATFGGYLKTSGFNSGQVVPDGGTPAVVGAPVGIDGQYQAAGYTRIGGAFEISGPAATVFAGYLTTADDFKSVGGTTLVGDSIVSGNGWLVGNLFSLGPVTFKGDLHHQSLAIATPLNVNGTDTQGPVTIKPACDCDPTHLLDVASIVAQGKANNDDAASGLAPSDFSNVVGIVDKTLPCGRYYFDSFKIIGSLTLHISSRVAIFIDGDIDDLGVLKVDLSGGGEVDIFATGTMHLTGTAGFGDQAHPAASRIYLGSSADVTLVGYDHFVGNLYAPYARVDMPGYMKLYGSLFVGEYLSGSYTELAYDSAILNAGDNCPVGPPPTCQQCGQCTGGQACVNGQCGSCTGDSDCCGLMKCDQGVCVNLAQ